jgi:hypothetical protein
VTFAAITLCVASQRVFIVVVYFVNDSVRKLLDTPLVIVAMDSIKIRRALSLPAKLDTEGALFYFVSTLY